MANKKRSGEPTSRAEAERTVLLADSSRTLDDAAAALGITVRAVQLRLKEAKRRYGIEARHRRTAEIPIAEPEIRFPDFPDEDISVEDKIELATKSFIKRRASHAAHTWFPINVRDPLPIGLCWFGDPHVDDDGCNWPVLRLHAKVCEKTEGMWGCNVGDTTNNWQGRLLKKYAEQNASLPTARQFAEWLMLGSGIRWLIWILGNHDAWGDGSAILAQMAKRYGTHKLICHDWEARFRLAFKNGWEPKIYTAHNFKGTSIYNVMHGPLREGLMGEDADLYVCGDKHTSGTMGFENVARGRYQHFLRVRGFKFMDDYARTHGFKEQSEGCSAVTILDPDTRTITIHMDVEEAADFLTWKRKKASRGRLAK